MITAGIDLGTAAIKVVFIDRFNLIWAKAMPTVPKQIEIAEGLIEEGLKTISVQKEALAGIAATGYGKRLFTGIEKIVSEISANAVGAHILSAGRAGTVINIGGQDVKIIRLSHDGKVLDFKMNDKCAAGTGRFFEMAERILNTPVGEFGDLGLSSRSPVCINSTCAVFAESELVSLLSIGTDKNDIIEGLHKSVARRISDITGGMSFKDDIYLDGGAARNRGLVSAVKEELMRDIKVFPQPQFTAAFGAAAILSMEKGE